MEMNATVTMSQNTGTITRIIDNKGFADGCDYDWSFSDAIHSSHNLRVVKSHHNAIFCTKCSYYNTGGPLMKLREQCPSAVPSERKHLHKLLMKALPNGNALDADCTPVTCLSPSGVPQQEQLGRT